MHHLWNCDEILYFLHLYFPSWITSPGNPMTSAKWISKMYSTVKYILFWKFGLYLPSWMCACAVIFFIQSFSFWYFMFWSGGSYPIESIRPFYQNFENFQIICNFRMNVSVFARYSRSILWQQFIFNVVNLFSSCSDIKILWIVYFGKYLAKL